jgi:hypothetical protein
MRSPIVFMAVYRFEGEAAALSAAYDRMLKSFPVGQIALHTCVVVPGGIEVYDACPSQAEFERFSTSAEFTGALSAAGMPMPAIRPLGEVHNTIVQGKRLQ